MDDISIIIPVGCTTSRLPYIGPIAQYYRLNNPEHNVEIIISEYGNDMLYKDIANEIEAKYLFISKNTQYYNKSKAVNAGMTVAQSEVCVMADSDMLPPNNIAKILTSELSEFDATWPCCYYYSTITTKDWALDEGFYKLTRPAVDGRRKIGKGPGGIFGINKTAYMSIGGMNEDFEGYGYEDTEFLSRASSNLKISVTHTSVAIHMAHDKDPGQCKFRSNSNKFNKLRSLLKDKKYIQSLKANLEKY